MHREARRCSAGEAGVIRTQGTTWRSGARFAVTEAANSSRSTDKVCNVRIPAGLYLLFSVALLALFGTM